MKIKSTLSEVLTTEPTLFIDKLVLETQKLTARQLLEALRIPPPHPRLILHILPPYSPNLNPIERVWKVMNEEARNNQVFKTFAEFKSAIQTFFSETWEDFLWFEWQD